MHIAEIMAKTDRHIRPLATFVPTWASAYTYSTVRKYWLSLFANTDCKEIPVPDELKTTVWGISFRSPICNSAGMFKNGEGYYTSFAMGAGAYLAGTTTDKPRKGNAKHGVTHPFLPYPRSGSASNWMGLPNAGHAAVAKTLSELPKILGFPIGASVAATPGTQDSASLALLTSGMKMYDRAGVDFIELNESCPNVSGHSVLHQGNRLDESMLERLEFIFHHFLKKRERRLPVILKFSVDTDINLVPLLVEVAATLKFDGINFGNTSVKYQQISDAIHRREKKNFDYFSRNFGGGISGRPLRNQSLELCQTAVQHIQSLALQNDFHVIRTGGIENSADVVESLQSGIALTQWYTGFFEYFSHYGFAMYDLFYKDLLRKKTNENIILQTSS